jgi:phosphoglycerol transferase MdoB-like AlkP superfamily enzyme
MSGERAAAWEHATILILCLILALGALGVVVWVFATGMFLTLDGLMLTVSCLVFALAFGGNVAWSLHTLEAQSALKELIGHPKGHGES